MKIFSPKISFSKNFDKADRRKFLSYPVAPPPIGIELKAMEKRLLAKPRSFLNLPAFLDLNGII